MSNTAHGQTRQGQILRHRYRVGEWVSLAQGYGYAQRTGTVYEIVAHLPSDRAHLQYRIRAAGEAFERVAAENQLTLQPKQPAAPAAPAPAASETPFALRGIRRTVRR